LRRAEATRDGNTIKLFFELRAGGYNGSTYTLIYDPPNDILKGVYFLVPARRTKHPNFTRTLKRARFSQLILRFGSEVDLRQVCKVVR
jgi:hypothetical protein